MSLIDHPPRGWVKALVRVPVKLFDWGLGWLFGGRLVLLHHRGRRSGRRYRTALEVVGRRDDPAVWYVAAGWGERADWLQNVRHHPHTALMVGRRVVPVVADVLDPGRAAEVYAEYVRARPATARLVGRLIGVDIRREPPERLASRMPIVALRAIDSGRGTRAAGEPAGTAVAPVVTTRAQTRATYDRIAPAYQLVEGLWERPAVARGLVMLDASPGEAVLDVGCGPGVALVRLARAVRPGGRAVGVDLSLSMCRIAERRIQRAHVTNVASVVEGDATRLPLAARSFDACLLSFTLELFDTPEIPDVLSELRRVLRPGGRIAVVSLSRAGPDTRVRRLYERGHEQLPQLLDCRPIHPAASLAQAGFDVRTRRQVLLWGLPVDVIVAVNPSNAVSRAVA